MCVIFFNFYCCSPACRLIIHTIHSYQWSPQKRKRKVICRTTNYSYLTVPNFNQWKVTIITQGFIVPIRRHFDVRLSGSFIFCCRVDACSREHRIRIIITLYLFVCEEFIWFTSHFVETKKGYGSKSVVL